MASFVQPLIGHLDAALTEFAKRFTQDGLIADQVAPIVPVGRQTDVYWIYDRASQMLTEKQLRAPGAPAERTRMTLSKDSYLCNSHALAAEIPDEERASYADVGDIEQDATQNMIAKLLLQRENDLATMMTDSAQVTNNVDLSTGVQWSSNNSVPADDVETAKALVAKSGVRANMMVIGYDVYRKLILHPTIRRFYSTGSGNANYSGRSLNAQDLATYFGIDNVLVGSAVSVAGDGATASFVWGKHAVVMYVSPGASRRDVSAVKTFRWTGAPGTAGGIGVVKARNPDPTAKGDIVGVDDYYQLKITAIETAYLIKDAVA